MRRYNTKYDSRKQGTSRAVANNIHQVVQRKMVVGKAGDKYEQEADRMADQVMRVSDHTQVQRKCKQCKEDDQVQRKPLNTETVPFVQRQPMEEEEEMVQAKAEGTPTLTPSFQSQLKASKGSGGKLLSDTNRFMSHAFGTNFNHVRVHHDSHAAQMSQSIQAKAFTAGNDIYFNKGQYSPSSSEGKKLLAHELTHTLQQNEGIRRQPFGGSERTLNRYRSIPIDYDMIPDPFVRQQLMQEAYEKWRWKDALKRLKKGELDDRDLKYQALRNRLTGLKTAEVTSLIAKIKAYQEQRDKDIKDPKVKDPAKKKPISTKKIIEWLEVRKEISTPMPDNAVVQSSLPGLIDGYTISFKDTVITVKPDTHGASGNETSAKGNFTGRFSWRVINGKIAQLKKDGVPFNPTKLEVTIVTKYKNSPDDTSAYGKGTTASDKANKTTTLRVHEGQHGTDYINYLVNTPMPVSLKNGINGQLTPAEFKKLLKYVKNITKDSCETTDQIGFSQDDFLKTAQGRASGIVSCRTP